jgi:hypothetical protein
MVGIMVGGLSISHLYCPVSQTNGYGSRYKVIYAFLNLYIFVFFARKSADLSLFTRKKCGKKLAERLFLGETQPFAQWLAQHG